MRMGDDENWPTNLALVTAGSTAGELVSSPHFDTRQAHKISTSAQMEITACPSRYRNLYSVYNPPNPI